jgi:hypothetical protein
MSAALDRLKDNIDTEMARYGFQWSPAEVGDWMQTWTGKKFYPLDPRPEDVEVLDIIYALGNLSRYNGHCAFYSVAEHSVLVSELVPYNLALQALMHDAAEAYISDIITPVKRVLGADCSFFAIEEAIWVKAIAPKFDLPVEHDPLVKKADMAILDVEKLVLHPRSNEWNLPKHDLTLDKIKICCLPPRAAQITFMKRYCELSGESFGRLFERFNELRNVDSESMNKHHK